MEDRILTDAEIETWSKKVCDDIDKYLLDNYGMDFDSLAELSDERYREIYLKICEVEEDMVCNETGDELSESGQIIADVVSSMGRAYEKGGSRYKIN